MLGQMWLLFMFLAFVHIVQGYPNGAPLTDDSCLRLQPIHTDPVTRNPYPNQQGTAPFRIEISTGVYQPCVMPIDCRRAPITVTIRGLARYFKGFIIQARTTFGGAKSHGQFMRSPDGASDPYIKGINCQNGPTLTHTSNNDVTSVRFQWIPEPNMKEPVYFLSTVVQTERIFYTNIRSTEVTPVGVTRATVFSSPTQSIGQFSSGHSEMFILQESPQKPFDYTWRNEQQLADFKQRQEFVVKTQITSSGTQSTKQPTVNTGLQTGPNSNVPQQLTVQTSGLQVNSNSQQATGQQVINGGTGTVVNAQPTPGQIGNGAAGTFVNPQQPSSGQMATGAAGTFVNPQQPSSGQMTTGATGNFENPQQGQMINRAVVNTGITQQQSNNRLQTNFGNLQQSPAQNSAAPVLLPNNRQPAIGFSNDQQSSLIGSNSQLLTIDSSPIILNTNSTNQQGALVTNNGQTLPSTVLKSRVAQIINNTGSAPQNSLQSISQNSQIINPQPSSVASVSQLGNINLSTDATRTTTPSSTTVPTTVRRSTLGSNQVTQPKALAINDLPATVTNTNQVIDMDAKPISSGYRYVPSAFMTFIPLVALLI